MNTEHDLSSCLLAMPQCIVLKLSTAEIAKLWKLFSFRPESNVLWKFKSSIFHSALKSASESFRGKSIFFRKIPADWKVGEYNNSTDFMNDVIVPPTIHQIWRNSYFFYKPTLRLSIPGKNNFPAISTCQEYFKIIWSVIGEYEFIKSNNFLSSVGTFATPLPQRT